MFVKDQFWNFCFLGMNKMVINNLEKLFVTNDAATILRELEVGNHLWDGDLALDWTGLQWTWLHLFITGTAPSCQNVGDGIPHARAGGWRWYKLCAGLCWSSPWGGRRAPQNGPFCVTGYWTWYLAFSMFVCLALYTLCFLFKWSTFYWKHNYQLCCLCFLFLSLQLIEGYEKACKKALEILPDCVCSSAKNLHDVKEAASYIRTAVASKQYGNEDFLANLIAQACGELILQIVGVVGLDLKKWSFCAIEIISLSLQCPFSRTLAVSTLIMSESAKYWWEVVVFSPSVLAVWFLFSSKRTGLFRVVGSRRHPCCTAWSLRRRSKETSHRSKMPRSWSSPAPLTVWWQRPRWWTNNSVIRKQTLICLSWPQFKPNLLRDFCSCSAHNSSGLSHRAQFWLTMRRNSWISVKERRSWWRPRWRPSRMPAPMW